MKNNVYLYKWSSIKEGIDMTPLGEFESLKSIDIIFQVYLSQSQNSKTGSLNNVFFSLFVYLNRLNWIDLNIYDISHIVTHYGLVLCWFKWPSFNYNARKDNTCLFYGWFHNQYCTAYTFFQRRYEGSLQKGCLWLFNERWATLKPTSRKSLISSQRSISNMWTYLRYNMAFYFLKMKAFFMHSLRARAIDMEVKKNSSIPFTYNYSDLQVRNIKDNVLNDYDLIIL